jgi:hypothetical protein
MGEVAEPLIEPGRRRIPRLPKPGKKQMTELNNATPVLSYRTDLQASDSWLARVVCGMSIVYGTVDVAYVTAKMMNHGASGVEPQGTDLPITICELAIILFGVTGLFRVRRSLFAIGFLSAVSVLLNWIGVWLLLAPVLKMTTPQDRAIVSIEAIYALQSAIAPVFIIICPQHPSVRGYFGQRGRF